MDQIVGRVAPGTPSSSAHAGATIHVRVQGVTKRFGAFAALDNVSLAVEQGKLVCFLGPSGCGKTTLLRVIAGLETQDAGRIEIGGRDVTPPPSQRGFGIVFQSYAVSTTCGRAERRLRQVNRRKAQEVKRAWPIRRSSASRRSA
jgi:iron(III) transport system ATP-binding protein